MEWVVDAILRLLFPSHYFMLCVNFSYVSHLRGKLIPIFISIRIGNDKVNFYEKLPEFEQNRKKVYGLHKVSIDGLTLSGVY
jgi:hypothetical protein